jgi:hypothetical protein
LYKLVYLLLLLAFVLTGCSHSTSLMREVDLQKLNHDVKTFADQNKSQNGIYLYSVAGENEYFIVNYSTAKQGEKMKFLADIRAEIRDDIFTILMDVAETSDPKDKRIKPLSIYQLKQQEKADIIKVIINGKETPIDVVGS